MVKKNQAKASMKSGKKGNGKSTVSPIAHNYKSANKPASLLTKDGATVVAHKEVASESVSCEATFSVVQTFAVQPAITSYSRGSPLGTWLPKVASEYDNYEFTSLKLHYVPTCATTVPGLIIMSYDPNPDGAAPDSFSSMKNANCATTGPARERLTLDISKLVKGRKLLTRDAPVTTYPLYDAGRVFVGSIAGSDIPTGYLEMEYVVKLTNPQTGPRIDYSGVVTPLNQATVYQDNVLSGAPGTQRWFGSGNANRNCFDYFIDCVQHAPLVYGRGAPVSLYGPTPRASLLNFKSLTSGVLYSAAEGKNVSAWQALRAGRFRLTATMPGDWQNYAMFGAEVLRWKVGNSPNLSNPIPATDVVLDNNGQYAEVPATYSGWRGLRSTVSGGTDNDDFVPKVDITFVAEVNDRFTLAVGIRQDTNVGENADAWLLYDTRAGISQVKLEFLGPLAGAA